jgi:hypothetical protein
VERIAHPRTEHRLVKLREGLAGFIALVLCACGTTQGTEHATPAVIVSADAISRSALQQAIVSMLGKPVTLADDALTHESVLTIERTAARDPSGRRIESRDTALPDTFRLIQRATQCILVHEATHKESVLRGVKCRAVEQQSPPSARPGA